VKRGVISGGRCVAFRPLCDVAVRFVAALILSALLARGALAQDPAGQRGQERGQVAVARAAAGSVGLFDRHCYAMLPELDVLRSQAARAEWIALDGRELRELTSVAQPNTLIGWKFSANGATYRIAATEGPVGLQDREDFPRFAAATAFTCTLTLPANATRAAVAAEMRKLMARGPEESYVQAGTRFDIWSGQTDKHLVILQHIGPQGGLRRGLLSVMLLVLSLDGTPD